MRAVRARVFAAIVAVSFAAAASISAPREANASVSIAITFDDLVTRSALAAIVTPFEQNSVWEGGKIFTYSHAHLDKVIAGSAANANASDGAVWVRTEGGIVGDIGQTVDGEAAFKIGKSTLVFLHPAAAGFALVTARAQGQFAIRVDPATHAQRFMRSAAVGVLLPAKHAVSTPTLASDVLHDRVVEDAVKDVASAWKRIHG